MKWKLLLYRRTSPENRFQIFCADSSHDGIPRPPALNEERSFTFAQRTLFAKPFAAARPSRADTFIPATAAPASHPMGSVKILSINCGLPRQVVWRGTRVTTSIFKAPVEGRIPLRTL